jgi:hypothetical protein
VTLCHQAGEEEEGQRALVLRQWGTIEYGLGQPPDDTEKRGPPGSVYIVEGSLKEVQQFRIGKKWGLDRRVRNEGVRGRNSPSRRRKTPRRGYHLPTCMNRSTFVGLETPSILAEVIAVPALDNIRETIG